MAVIASSCRRPDDAPRLSPQVSGTLEVDGLSAPVRVVRDRWGVPHVYAQSRDDVFFAQGFVQAEDRLFQMDLWRRAAQGRLAEVLGANFIERDAMTRRLQYTGDVEAEWASYGADARPIARAFVSGVNAWVRIARDQLPELFRTAGWAPAYWTADDLLNRTDAFDRDGTIELARESLPPAVVDAVRRAAVPPFFTGLARPPLAPVPARATNAAAPADDADTLPAPSALYLIHLQTPNWNAAGATPPWRPGLTTGHDAAATWERNDPRWRARVTVAPLDPTAGRIVKDTIVVKGRREPFAFTTQLTPAGVVVATDREEGKEYVLDWEGFKPGTAPTFAPGGASVGRDRREGREGREGRDGLQRVAVFAHPLAITAAARARFNIGPLRHSANAPAFTVSFDQRVWDASPAMNAPGQSEWPASDHYADLAALWSAGKTFPLVYSDAAVNANAQATLTLVPRRRR